MVIVLEASANADDKFALRLALFCAYSILSCTCIQLLRHCVLHSALHSIFDLITSTTQLWR